MYLGSEISNTVNMDGFQWSYFSSEKYVAAALNDVYNNMADNNSRLTYK